MSRAATSIEWLALLELRGDVTIFLSREEREEIGCRKFGGTRISRSWGGGGTRGHLRRALRNRKTLFDGSSTYGTRDQTYLEEKIRLEGAAVSAENVAEVERKEAAESLPNVDGFDRRSFKLSLGIPGSGLDIVCRKIVTDG